MSGPQVLGEGTGGPDGPSEDPQVGEVGTGREDPAPDSPQVDAANAPEAPPPDPDAPEGPDRPEISDELGGLAPGKHLRHEFTPRGAALRLLSAQGRGRQVLLSGPAGTGKSRACMEKINLVCLLRPGTRVLIVRKTLASLTATGLVTWREKVIPQLLASGKVRFFGGNKEMPAQYIYNHDGGEQSVVVVGGMDKPTKIMSGEYDLIYVQEATELVEDDWQALSTRLRNGNLTYHQLLGDCNPDAPTHWLNVRCLEGKTEMLHSVHQDNPQFYDQVPDPSGPDGFRYELTEAGRDYIQGTLGDLSGVWRLRMLDGVWAAAEGMIYTEFNRSLHVVNRPTFLEGTRLCSAGMPWDWPRFWTIDFGYQHPFVLQRWAVDPDGAGWLYGEQYMTHMIVEEHVQELKTIVMNRRGQWTEPRPVRILADHDAEDRETFHKHMMGTKAANKQVKRGLQACMSRLKPNAAGKPGVYFINGAVARIDPRQVARKRPTCTIDEFASYVWADGEHEVPNKEHDDGLDGFRYFVADRDLSGTTKYRSFNPGQRAMRIR